MKNRSPEEARQSVSDDIIATGLREFQRRLSAWADEYHPQRKRKVGYIAMHLGEEVGEVYGELRQNHLGRTYGTDAYGLSHPEGLGSEIADAIGVLVRLAECTELDLGDDVLVKLRYLEAKLAAKKKARKHG